jgi:hypothetical protein
MPHFGVYLHNVYGSQHRYEFKIQAKHEVEFPLHNNSFISTICISVFCRHLTLRLQNILHINCLQLLVVIVAVKIWGKKLKGKKLFIFCDNEDSVTVVNSGSTKDSFMQNCLRELNLLCICHLDK